MFTEEVSLPDGLSSFLGGVGAEIIINIMIKVIIVVKLMMIMGVNRRMIKKRSRDLIGKHPLSKTDEFSEKFRVNGDDKGSPEGRASLAILYLCRVQ